MQTSKHIRSWFPTLIYEDILSKFNQHNGHLESKAYEIQQQSPTSNAGWSCDTYNTLFHYDALSDNDVIIQELLETCKEKVIDFALEYGVKKTKDKLECVDFWFNISKNGSYQEYHLHPKSEFSLVYYIKTKPNCGNIVFQNTNSLMDMFPLITNEPTYASHRTCFYTPKDALVLIFRSNLTHMVEKNLSGEDRISIAMNFRFKEG